MLRASSCELRATFSPELQARGSQLPPRCYTLLIMAEGRSRVWLWLLFGGGAFLLFVVAVFTPVYFTFRGGDQESFSGFGEKIAVVDLEGVILSPKQTVTQLKKFADDDSIKA